MSDLTNSDTPAGFVLNVPKSATAEGVPEGFVPNVPNTPEPVHPSPAPFQERIEQGDKAAKAFEEMLKKPYSERVKEWSAEQLKQGEYRAALGGTLAASVAGVGEAVVEGAKSAGDVFFNKVLSGAGLRREDYTDIPGKAQPLDELVGHALAMQGVIGPYNDVVLGGRLSGRPLINAGNGQMARLVTDPDTGAMHAQPVGEFPPRDIDFKNAASVIEGKNVTVRPTTADKLRAIWESEGLHPAEVAEEARTNLAVARDLSAASSPPLPLPVRPSKTYIHDIENTFQKLRGAHTADQSEFLNRLDELPSAVKDPEVGREWYKHAEGDPTADMTPEDGRLYNEHAVPMKQEELRLYEEVSKSQLDVSEFDPAYMHRAVVGKTPSIDRIAGEGTEANPIYHGPGLMARTTSSMHERRYFVAENALGERRVVSIKEGELRSVGDGERSLLKHSQEEPLKKGDEFSMGENPVTGDDGVWKVTDAYTREIEAATATRYYKNFLANTIDNIIHLRAAARAIYTAQQIRSTPEWAQYTIPVGRSDIPAGWRSPEMPLFRNDMMDPKLASAIDDFYGNRSTDGLGLALEKINRFAVGSMFWTPVPHAANAGTHWAMARSWDWIKPAGLKSLAVDGATAIREVVTQGPKYQELLREGSGLLYAGVKNRDFYQKLLDRAGFEFEKDPVSFASIAKAVGMAPIDLTRGIYNASSKALWAASDIFMMQRVLELQAKGLPVKAAIYEAEKLIPSYKVPSEILGSRSLQQIYTNPSVFQFSRYHYGVLEGYANLAKDLAVGNASQKANVIGSIMALGTLQLMIWPLMSAMLQNVTGEEGLKVPSFGPGRLSEPGIGAVVNATPNVWPEWVKKYYHNDTTMMQQVSNLIPLAPVTRGGLEIYQNRYSFTGRPVAEPSDWREGNVGRVAAQQAEHAAQTMVEPYSAVNTILKQNQSLPMGLIERAFGLKNQTADQEMAKERAFRYQDKQSRKRARKPLGPIESLAND